MKILSRIVIFTIILFSATAKAENLVDLFNLALDNDALLKAAQAKRDGAKEARPQSIANFLPKIEVVGSIGRYSQDLQSFGLITDPIFLVPETYTLSRFSLNLRQPILNLQHWIELSGANMQLTRADIEYRTAQQNLLLRLAESYFTVLTKEGGLNFARAEKNAIARQLQTTRQRYDVGIVAVTDVHEAQARHDLAVAQEILAETELAAAQEKLRQITGIVPRTLFKLRAQTPLVPPTPTNINEWVDAARSQNLLIALQQLNADIAKNAVEQKRAEQYPTLDVTGRYGYFDQNGTGINAQTYQDSLISLDLSYSIFEGNRSSSLVRQAVKRQEEENQKTEQIEREVMSNTRSAYLGVLAGMSYVKALGQALTSSESALKATEAGFDAGTRTAIEVLDAQRELYRNQREFVRARVEYILNTLRLKEAVGLLTIDDIEQVNGWLE